MTITSAVCILIDAVTGSTRETVTASAAQLAVLQSAVDAGRLDLRDGTGTRKLWMWIPGGDQGPYRVTIGYTNEDEEAEEPLCAACGKPHPEYCGQYCPM